MELDDIKTGLIFKLSWSDNLYRIGGIGKQKLLSINFPIGFFVDPVYYESGFDDYYKGTWVIGKRLTNIYSKEEMLLQFTKGNWIPIKNIARYKHYTHECY